MKIKLGSLSILVALCAVSFAAQPAVAKDVRFPATGNPAFSLRIPDDWTTEEGDDDSLLVASGDHSMAFTLMLETGDKPWDDDALDEIATVALKVAKAAPPKRKDAVAISGFPGFSYPSATTNDAGDVVRLTVYIIQIDKTHLALFNRIEVASNSPAQRKIADFIANQGQEAAQNFARIFESTRAQLADAEQEIARGVLELACELARQVLRHELSVKPNVLQPVIREALGLLMAESKSVVVRLNPLDLDVLKDVVRAEFPGLSLTLLADAMVTRGGCLIESAGTVVDATLEKRWMRALASLGLSSPWEDLADER